MAKSLAEVIRRGIKRKGWTFEQVSMKAAAAGLEAISRSYLSGIVCGFWIPSIKKLLSICTVLGIDFKECQQMRIDDKIDGSVERIIKKSV